MASDKRTAKVGGSSEAGCTPGTQFGQYTIARLLGRGGMGTVYEAFHSSLQRRVALKTIRRERLSDEGAVDRFRREMALIGQLHHPHIVLAYDAGEIDGMQYLAMEFVDGENVAILVRRCGVLSIADACEIVRQAALGLQHAHDHGLIHRDVKPSNLLINRAGQVKVSDLGLARHSDEEHSGERLTIDGQALGTVDYMSPEQIRGESTIDGRCDMYSCGCTLFELLVGRAPFAGPGYKTGILKLMAHQSTPPDRPHDLRREVPPELNDIVLQLLEKLPERRLASAGELAERLAPFARGADLKKVMRLTEHVEGMVLDSATCPTPPGATHSTVAVRYPSAAAPGSPFAAPRSTPPAVSGRSPNRTVGALAGIAIAIVAALTGYALRRPGSDSRSDLDQSDRSSDLAVAAAPERVADGLPLPADAERKVDPQSKSVEIPRLQWFSLLKNEPERTIWPEEGGIATWQFKPEQDQYSVNCPGEVLVSLCETAGDRFRFEVDIGQAGWVGRVGIAWGLREFDDGVRSGWEFQLIRLGRYERDYLPKYRLIRTTERRNRTDTGYGGNTVSNSGAADVAMPRGETSKLELRVVNGVLKGVWWAGAPIEELCTKNPAAIPAGRIALYVQDADAVIRSPRLKRE